jgi:hypothetical protein
LTTVEQESGHTPGEAAAKAERQVGGRQPAAQGTVAKKARGSGRAYGLNGLARTMRTSLVLRSDLPLDSWKQVGERIFVICESSAWWIGDWLLFGKSKYPDRYRQAIEETSLDYQTLRNYAWVAGRFSVSRRRDKLSFQHHVEVASLQPDEQDLWLDRAEKFGWSRNELRAKLRAQVRAGRDSAGRDSAKTEITVRLSVSQERKERWQAAAERAGVDIVHWIAMSLDQMASPGDSATVNAI